MAPFQRDPDKRNYLDINIEDYSDDELLSVIDEETAAFERDLAEQNATISNPAVQNE